MVADTVVLEGEKVAPRVDFFFSLGPADDGMKVGLSDEVLHLALSFAFQLERIFSFSSLKSASMALKSSSELRCRASLNTP